MSSAIEAPDFPFFKLSDSQDLILFLIQKELQGAKFISELNKIGFDSSFFDIDLGVVILTLLGFKDRSDELWDWYYKTLDSYAAQVDLWETNTARDLALNFYLELRTKFKSGL